MSLQHKTPLFYTSKDTARVPLPTFLDVFNCFADDADSHVMQRHKFSPLRPWNTTEKGFKLLSLNSSIVMGSVAPKNRRRANPGSCIAAAAATPAKIETPNSAHVLAATTTTASMSRDTTTASMSLPIAPCQSSREARNRVNGPDQRRCRPGKYLQWGRSRDIMAAKNGEGSGIVSTLTLTRKLCWNECS